MARFDASAVRLLSATIGAAAAVGLPGASTAAAAPGCATISERTLVTWTSAAGLDGATVAARTTSRRDPLYSIFSPDPELLSGLAAGQGPTSMSVAVERDRDGRGRPVLCDGRKQIAAMPTIRRDELIGSASVNGRRVAWRTWRPTATGVMRVATVHAGRARNVHHASVPVLARRDSVSTAIHLLPSGTVAWKVGPSKTARSWVWPIGKRPVKIAASPPTPNYAAPSIRIVDDRNVLVDDTIRAYRPPTRGVCSRVIAGGKRTNVGGWTLTRINDGTLDDDQEFSSDSTALICDPTTGIYVAATDAGGSSGTYVGDPGGQFSVDHHRAGDWLLITRTTTGEGVSESTTTEGRNVRTSEHFDAYGSVELAGVPHPAPGTPSVPGTSLTWTTAATAGPGYVAWCSTPETTGKTAAVWLSDGQGTRRLAEIPPGSPCALNAADGQIQWGPAYARSTQPVTPAPNRAFG